MVEASTIQWQTCLRPLPPAEWTQLLSEFADGNFYQTHAYGSVSWGRSSLTHLVIRESDCVRAIAQIREIRFAQWFGVAYVRWGPCAQHRSETWSARAFRAALEALGREFVQTRRWVTRVIPNLFEEDEQAPTALQVLQQLGFRKDATATPYRTVRVGLTSSLEEIRKRLDGKWRNQLNAAMRNGLEIAEGNDGELFGRFMVLYDEMMARKRFNTTVDVREFARIQEKLSPGEKMRVALAGQSGRLHAGMVATALGETGIYLLGATGQEGLKSKASYLLQWRMIEYLRTMGCRSYDLGGINPRRNPGVYHFKSGIGGAEVHQLGRFELAPSEARRRLLHVAECWHKAWRSWRQRIRQ